MKKNAITLAAAALLLLCSSAYFYKQYLLKPSRDISSEIPSFELSAERLANAYRSDIKKADSLYLNKTIEVTGIATKAADSVIQLDRNVFCLLSGKIQTDIVGKKVTVKGKCIGYDELFEEIKLDQCTINK